MPKRHRTRAQKARALQHRTRELKLAQRDAQPIRESVTSQPAGRQPASVSVSGAPPKGHDYDLQRSLRLLAILILLQLIIWAVFSSTELDTKLYESIRV